MHDEMRDRVAIQHLMSRYNVNGDRGRFDALADCFTADGTLSFGGETAQGRAAIIERLTRPAVSNNPARTIVRHNVTSSLIEVAGDTATGRSYFVVLTDIGLDHHGIYTDAFIRVGDDWLIARREVRTDWQAADSLYPRLAINRRHR